MAMAQDKLTGNFHWQSNGYIDKIQYNYQFHFYEDNKFISSCVLQEKDTLIQNSRKGIFKIEGDILILNITHESLPQEKGELYFRYETLSEITTIKMEMKIIENKLIIKHIYGENIFGIFHKNKSVEYDKIIHWIL